MLTITTPSIITDLQREIRSIWSDLDWQYFDLFIELVDDDHEVFHPDVPALLDHTRADLSRFMDTPPDEALYRMAFSLALEQERRAARETGLEVRG